MLKKKLYIAVLLLIPFFFSFNLQAAAASGDVTLTPLSLDSRRVVSQKLEIPADSNVHQLKLSVTNFSGNKKALILTGVDPVTDFEGKLVYQDKTFPVKTAPFKFAAVIQKQSITIAAGQTLEIATPIKIPTQFSGHLLGGIRLTEDNQEAALLPVTVLGSKEKINHANVSVNQLVAKNITGMPAVGVRFVNDVGVLEENLTFDLKLTQESFFGLIKKTWQARQAQVLLAPFSTFEKGISLQGMAISAGSYHLTGTIKSSHQQIKLDQHFTITKADAKKVNDAAKVAYRDNHPLLLLIIALLGLLLIGVIFLAIRQAKKKKTSDG